MFKSFKNKIEEEQGAELQPQLLYPAMNNPAQKKQSNWLNGGRHSFANNQKSKSYDESSTSGSNHQSDLMGKYRLECKELHNQLNELQGRIKAIQNEKLRLEKANEILLETVKVAQTQKDLYYDEQERIQNAQRLEIDKFKGLLAKKEDEALEHLTTLCKERDRNSQLNERMNTFYRQERQLNHLKDELENLRHSSELERNNFITQIAALTEDKRQLKLRLEIIQEARSTTFDIQRDDVGEANSVAQERKLLEQHLEEAHLQLSEIKSAWSGQKLALETQVNRLSKQVAEETAEKRRLIENVDDLRAELIKFDSKQIQWGKTIMGKNDKIELLNGEIDELNYMIISCREDCVRQISEERNKMIKMEKEKIEMEKTFTADIENAQKELSESNSHSKSLEKKINELNMEMKAILVKILEEQNEKNIALLKNAEIQQSDDLLRQELREERNNRHEVNERNQELETENRSIKIELTETKNTLLELQDIMQKNQHKFNDFERLEAELFEKNNTIKSLNLRIADLKKTLQMNFNTQHTLSQSTTTNKKCATECQVMDEINFKYLKHVIFKFLTSREVEAIHLIKAVSTLLHLTKDEEKLLHDTLEWKMSWFGTKPNHGSGQFAFSIPPPS